GARFGRGGDSDADGIPDADDMCPEEPENFNGFEDSDGCPDRARVIIESSSCIIIPQIHFREGDAAVLPEAMPIVEQVAQVMINNPSLRLVEIQGHSDNLGSAAENMRVSLARARAVMAALVKLGVPASRLRARGFGATLPIAQNVTDEARAKNRRVEF